MELTFKNPAEFAEAFQNEMLSYATGGNLQNDDYQRLRKEFLEQFGEEVPKFVRVNRDTKQLWAHFKKVADNYKGRREHIWAEFEPLLSKLEGKHSAPVDEDVTQSLTVLSSESVRRAWDRALERRADEPDAAITAARTLLESVCKHVLDDLGRAYPDDADLPKLYRLTAEGLNLAPSQQTEQIFKQVMGGVTAVVEGVGAIRNKLGDAHGTGKTAPLVEKRHGSLAVNLAGAAAMFIVESWEARSTTAT